MASDPLQGTRASVPSPIVNSRAGRFLCSLLRTAAAALRIGVSGKWVSFAGSFSSVGEHRHLFRRLYHNVGGVFALPDDVDAALGMGLERPGNCCSASHSQYWNGGNLQIQDRMAIFPGNLRRVSKGS